MRSILCLLAVFISGTNNLVYGLSKTNNLEADRIKKDVFNVAMQFVVQPWNLRQTPKMVKTVLNTINETINEEEHVLNYVSKIIKKLQTELSHSKNVSLTDSLWQSSITEKEWSDIENSITDDKVGNIKKIHQGNSHSDYRPNEEKQLTQNSSYALEVITYKKPEQKEHDNCTQVMKIKKLKTPVKENNLTNVNQTKISPSNIYSVFNRTDLEHRQVPYEEVFKSSLDSTYENTSEINKENLTQTLLYVIGLKDKEVNRSRVDEHNVAKGSSVLFVNNIDTIDKIVTFKNGLKFISPFLLDKNGKLKINITKYANNGRLPDQNLKYTFDDLRNRKQVLKNKIQARNQKVLLHKKIISLHEIKRNETIPNNDVKYLTNLKKLLSGQVFNIFAEKRRQIKQHFKDKLTTTQTLKNIVQKIQHMSNKNQLLPNKYKNRRMKKAEAITYGAYKNEVDQNFNISGYDIGEHNEDVEMPIKISKENVNKSASAIYLKNDEILQPILLTATTFRPTIISPEFVTAVLSKTTIEEIFSQLDKPEHNISKRFYLLQPNVNRNPNNKSMLKIHTILKQKNLKLPRYVNMKKLINDIFNVHIAQSLHNLTNPKHASPKKKKPDKSTDNIRNMNEKLRQSSFFNKGNVKIFNKNDQLGYVTRYFLKDTVEKPSRILRFGPQTLTDNEKEISKDKCMTCFHDTSLDMILVNARKESLNSDETSEFKNKMSKNSSKTIEHSKLFPPKSREARSLRTIFLDSLRQVPDYNRPQVTLFKQHNVRLVQSPSFSLHNHEFNDMHSFAIRGERDNTALYPRTAYKQELTLNSNRRQNRYFEPIPNLSINRTPKYPVLYNIREHGLMNNPIKETTDSYSSSYTNSNKLKFKHSLRPRELLRNVFGVTFVDHNDPNKDGTENLSIDINNVDISDDLLDQIGNLGEEISTQSNKHIDSQNDWRHYLIQKTRTAKSRKHQDAIERFLRTGSNNVNTNKQQVNSSNLHPKKKHQGFIYEDIKYKLKPDYNEFHSENSPIYVRSLQEFAEEFKTNKEMSRREEEYKNDNRLKPHPMERFYSKDNNEMHSADNFHNIKIISNRVPEVVVETDGFIHHKRMRGRPDLPKHSRFKGGETGCHDDFQIDSEQIEEEKDAIFKNHNENSNYLQPEMPYADEFVRKYENNDKPNRKNRVPISLLHSFTTQKIYLDKNAINSLKLFSEPTSQDQNPDKKKGNVNEFDFSMDEVDAIKSSPLSSEAFILVREKKENADKNYASIDKMNALLKIEPNDEVSALETQTIHNVLPVKLQKQDISVKYDWKEVATTPVQTHEQNVAVSDWENENISLHSLSGATNTHQENEAVSGRDDISLYEVPSATSNTFDEKKYTEDTFKPVLPEKDQLLDSDYQDLDMPSKLKPVKSAIQSKTLSFMPLSQLSRAMLPEKKIHHSSFFHGIDEKHMNSVSQQKDVVLDNDYQESNMFLEKKTSEATTPLHTLLFVPFSQMSRGILPKEKEYKDSVLFIPNLPKQDPLLNTNYYDSNFPSEIKLPESTTLSNSPSVTPLSQINRAMLSEKNEYISSVSLKENIVEPGLPKKHLPLNINNQDSNLSSETKSAESAIPSNFLSFMPLSQKSPAMLPEEKEYISSVTLKENIFEPGLPKKHLPLNINNQDSNLSSETKSAESAIPSNFLSFMPLSQKSPAMLPEEKEYISSVTLKENIFEPGLPKKHLPLNINNQDSNLSSETKSAESAIPSNFLSFMPLSQKSPAMLPEEKEYISSVTLKENIFEPVVPKKDPLLNNNYYDSKLPSEIKLAESTTLPNSLSFMPVSRKSQAMLPEEKEYTSSVTFKGNIFEPGLPKKREPLNINYQDSNLSSETKSAKSAIPSNFPSFSPLSQKSRAKLPEKKEYISSVPFKEHIIESVLPKKHLLLNSSDEVINWSSYTKYAKSAIPSTFPFQKSRMLHEDKGDTSSVSFFKNTIRPLLWKNDTHSHNPSYRKLAAMSSNEMMEVMPPDEKMKSDSPTKFRIVTTDHQDSNKSLSQMHRVATNVTKTPILHITSKLISYSREAVLTARPSKAVSTDDYRTVSPQESAVYIDKKRKKEKKNISHNTKHIMTLWSKHNFKELNFTHLKASHLLDMWHHESLEKPNLANRSPHLGKYEEYRNRIQENYDEYRPPEEELVKKRKKRSKHSSKKRQGKGNNGRRSPRLLCIVMKRSDQRPLVPHIQNTWGKRCNVLIFVTMTPLSNNEEETWRFTRAVLKYIKKKYRRYADWFLKADIDTYVAISNLKKMFLSSYSTKIPMFLGCSGAHNYKSFIISKKALTRLTKLGPNTTHCSQIQDMSVDACLDFLNIYKANDAYCDRGGKLSAQEFLHQADHQPFVTAKQKFHQKKVFLEHVTVEDMYLIEYFLHRRHLDATPKTIMVRSRLIDGD